LKLKTTLTWYAFGAFLLGLLAYLMTMSRYLMNTDHGELATVAISWGTAHPTGYPLFTFLGYLFSQLPIPVRPLLKLNILNAIYCAVALPFLFYAFRNFLTSTLSKKEGNMEFASLRDLSAFVGSLGVAFSITIWAQATSFEVYSLHFLLLSALLWSLSRISGKGDRQTDRSWLLMALVLALGFTNHLSIIVILPAIAYWYFGSGRINFSSLILLLKMIGLFCLPLLVFYGILWFRAGSSPLLNWGDPSSAFAFWRHVSGAQYRVWMFESGGLAMENLRKFLVSWPGEFSYLSWLMAILGMIILWFRNRRILIFSLFLFLGNVFYVVNYSIHDLEPYFLLAYISTGIWLTFGFQWLCKSFKVKTTLALLMAFVLISFEILMVYAVNDKSSDNLIENYSTRALESLPPNSLLISRQWDVFNSPAYYLQFVEGKRKDVEIVGKELLRRSWYFSQLEGMYPKTMAKIEGSVLPFLQALKPFERDEKYDAKKLSMLYQTLFESLILSNIQDRPVFIGPEIFVGDIRGTGEWALPTNVSIYPEKYFLRLSLDGPKMESFEVDYDYVKVRKPGIYANMIRENIGQMRTYQALFLLSIGKKREATKIAREIKRNFREIIMPQALVDIL
jgi:Protein O-mannosyl-transferase TMEM260-like